MYLLKHFILLLISILMSVFVLPSISLAEVKNEETRTEFDKANLAFLKGKRFIFDEIPGRSDNFEGWLTPAGRALVLNKIQKAGFNVFSPCIWHGRGALYAAQSNIPREDKFLGQIAGKNNDSFYRLIEEAHSRNIQVYPWFCVSLRDPPLHFLTEFYDKEKTPDRAFDMHRPGFQKYIVDAMVDIVETYNIDGFFLDLIRTQGICTCNFCQEEYRMIYKENLLTDVKYRKINPIAKMRLGAWQRDAVSKVVSTFSQRVKAIKPHVKITASGHPDVDHDILFHNGRDLIYWYNKGWIDFMMAMDYNPELNHKGYKKILPTLKDPAGLVLIIGNYEKIKLGKRTMTLPRNSLIVERLVRESIEQYDSKAFGVYWYHSLSDEQVEQIRNINIQVNGF